MKIPWLKNLQKTWLRLHKDVKIPHAIMIIGPIGVGKRIFANWLSQRYLCDSEFTFQLSYPIDYKYHPDQHWIKIPEDKKNIGIDQIRSLIDNLYLTSHGGVGKVAIIDAANKMTQNASNSLLKTLEEPPEDTLLILIADRVRNIPPTIFSRCQKIMIPIPQKKLALEWLNQVKSNTQWSDVLEMISMGPIDAIDQIDNLELSASMKNDFLGLMRGTNFPIEIAEKWVKYEFSFVINWISQMIHQFIKISFSDDMIDSEIDSKEIISLGIKKKHLFHYLDAINNIRAQEKGSLNIQLALENLFIQWAMKLDKTFLSEQIGIFREQKN